MENTDFEPFLNESDKSKKFCVLKYAWLKNYTKTSENSFFEPKFTKFCGTILAPGGVAGAGSPNAASNSRFYIGCLMELLSGLLWSWLHKLIP
jgi:hypothetical protein